MYKDWTENEYKQPMSKEHFWNTIKKPGELLLKIIFKINWLTGSKI